MRNCFWFLAFAAQLAMASVQWDSNIAPVIETDVPTTNALPTPTPPTYIQSSSKPPPYGPPAYSTPTPAQYPSSAAAVSPPPYNSIPTGTAPTGAWDNDWGNETTFTTSVVSPGYGGGGGSLPPLPYQTWSSRTKPYVPPWLHTTSRPSTTKTWRPWPSSSQTVIQYDGGGW